MESDYFIELETRGRDMIEEGLGKSLISIYDLHLYFDKDLRFQLGYPWQVEDIYGSDLFDFGRYDDGHDNKYRKIHEELIAGGETELIDFEEWFSNECCLDSEVDEIYKVVEEELRITEQISETIIKAFSGLGKKCEN